MAEPSRPNVQAARRATQGFFLLSGVAAGTWAPMVPFAKVRLGLDEGHLGVMLLCLGFGAVGAMPIAGFLSHHHGNRRVLAVGGLAVCLALPLLAIAPSMPALGAALIGFGGFLGVLDVAMNAHAVDVEKLHGRPLMSGFHAMYSIGGLAGAAGMSALLGTGAPLAACAVAIAVLLLAIAATQWRHVIDATHDAALAQPAMFALPSPAALVLGALCLVIFLAEGAMLDWSALLLRASRGVAIANAGLGYAAFSVAMATGRLLGDRITARLGPARVVRLGSLVAAAGMLAACALPWAWSALIGFALVGIGASNIVPVLFSAAGRIPGTAPSVSIAAVTTLGYAGMLAGPAVIGLVARATSLPIALGAVGALVALVAAGASRVRAAP
ncbi:MAG TPA: MFS transporter [Kofleriaceae bacterium]|nr:MFS transporter [Kofleriaceae bacterium]